MVNRSYKKAVYTLAIILCFSLLSISIGFSAMSTTLTVNGNASFEPVDMIRVISLENESLIDSKEISSKYSVDSINVLLDINSSNSSATYTAKIKNFGQIDKELARINEEVFSNENMEYQIEGLKEGDVIKAKEEVIFKITFKQKDTKNYSSEKRLNAKLKFVFDDYQNNDVFPVVFEQKGACTFNGASNITGDDCLKYQGVSYIDTGVSLYSLENYKKDFEVGFTIENYDGTEQEYSQSTLFNSKNENGSMTAPGLVFRLSGTSSNFEITQAINSAKTAATFPISSVQKVVIIRKNNIVYYSLNDGNLTKLQDMGSFNEYFDLTACFGAIKDKNNSITRNVIGTLSNMYIKLGTYQAKQYTVTFDANGGDIDEKARTVTDNDSIGTLPIPTNDEKIFDGWYTDLSYKTKIDENTIINNNVTYYAKWSALGVAEINGKYYSTIVEAVNSITTSDETTIKLLNDTSAAITIGNGKNVVLDFKNYIISNKGNAAVIENNGNLKIINGKFTSNTATAIINNNSSGVLTITGGEFTATGTKQAIYNKGGILTISGNPYFSSTSSIRATIHNLDNGKLTLIGGTIISTNHSAIVNDSGIMVIGTKDGVISNTKPMLQGKTYGISSSVDYSLYDGILKGQTSAINNIEKITEIEDNSKITYNTENIDNVKYKTLYLN